MPSARITSLSTLESLAKPANTIASNQPKPQKQPRQSAPNPLKATVPQSNRGSGKAKQVIGSFDKGGKVSKTGLYKAHKGERVLNTSQTKKAEKSSGMLSVLCGGKC